MMMIHFRFMAKVFDVETAFLYRKLEDEIYMQCLTGIKNIAKDDYIILGKCIYDLVESSRQYNKKATEILKKVSFIRGNVNSLLFMKNSQIIQYYVDDNLMILNPAAIDEAVEQVKKNWLLLKISDSLEEYLLCKIRFSKEKKKAWLGQLFLMKNMENKFHEQLIKV